MEDQLLENYDLVNKKAKTRMIIFIGIILVLLIITSIFIILYISEKNNNDNKSNENSPSEKEEEKKEEKEEEKKEEKEVLTLWNDCNAKKTLMDYIQKITQSDSSSFIKIEDRIAVFDLDGTLFQETDPVYTDYKLYKYRVLEDPNYINKATEEQIEVANYIKELIETGKSVSGLDLKHAKSNAEVFANMTLKEYENYAKVFLNESAEGYNNLKRGDAFYKPMLQVIDYLQENNFTVYIVSGTDRFTVRAIIDGHINIPKGHVIGSEAKIIASKQGNEDGFNYTFTQDDYLIFKGEVVVKNLYMNKVHHIIREIGKTPVLSFGNSKGDSSMANFVISNKDNIGLAFMLLCDDTERENGNIAKANEMQELCNNNNWIAISMKNDWTTIYGENVTRKKE